ncbi:MAG: cyeA, partial [Frankiales bacterium]|nr:cyeA [Frankiales bacterium]
LVAAFAARCGGDHERLDRTRLLGLALGFGGVGALVGLDVRGGDLLSVAEVAVVVVCYATGPLVVARWLADLPAAGVNGAALAATALVYAPFGGRDLEVPSGKVVWAVVGLALLCTVVALLAFFALIAEAGPQRALVITYVNPAVALALGIVLLSEPFTAGAAVGFPLVLAGCVLATRRSAPPAPVDEQVLAEPVARP